MQVSPATRARRRDATRTGHQLPTPLANAILWDVILQTCERVADRPVVRFRGHYYLADGHPCPALRQFCKLMARPDNPGGDLCITSDGLVSKWSQAPGRRWERRREIVGVQEDVQPVVSLPVAGAGAIARAVRTALSGGGQGPDDEQLPGGIRRRVPGDHQPELHPKAGA